jgi:hypothetical protein
VFAYKVLAHKAPAYDELANKVSAHKVHAHETLTYETPAHEMLAHKVSAHEGFYEDLARQNTVARRFQRQLGIRRRYTWVSV